MAEIRWTDEAVKWLRDIYDYIFQDNPNAAANVISGLFDKVQILGEFPEVGYKYQTVEEGDIRILLYGHYRIAYLIKGQHSIEILGVFHGALKIERYLP